MHIRTVFLILASVIFITAGGLFLFSRTERAREIAKNLIERNLNEIDGFDIRIGEIRAESFSRIEIKDLEARIEGENFLKIKKLSAGYSIPLLYSVPLHGKLHLSDTRVEGMELRLARDGSGTWNFSRLKTKGDPKANPQKRRISISFRENRVHDSGVTVTYVTREGKAAVKRFRFVDESLFSLNLVELTRKVEIQARGVNFDYASSGVRIRDLSGKIDIASWDCELEDVRLALQGVPLEGNGTIRNLRAPEFDVKVIPDPLKWGGRGKISLVAQADVKMHSPDNMTGTIRVATLDSFLNGREFRTEFKPLVVEGTKVSLEGTMSGEFGESRVRGDFDFRKWFAGGKRNEFDFHVATKSLKTDDLLLAAVGDESPVKFGYDPKLDSEVRVAGSWETLENFSIALDTDSFRAVDGTRGEISVEGSAVFRNGETDLNLVSRMNDFRIKSGHEDVKFDSRLDGTASAEGTVYSEGGFTEKARLRVTADVEVEEIHGIRQITASTAAEIGNGNITLESLDLNSEDFFFSAKKREGSGEGLDCAFEFSSRDLGFLSRIDERIEIRGSASSRGTISGSVFSPLVVATSRIENFFGGSNLAARELAITSSVKISREDPLIDIVAKARKTSVFGNSPDAAEIRISGAGERIDIEAALSKKDGSFVSSLIEVDQAFSYEKKMLVKKVEGLINEKPLKTAGDVVFVYSPERKELRVKKFFYGGGALTDFVLATNGDAKTIEIAAEVENLDQRIISKIFNFKTPLNGSLTGKINVGGDFGTPDVEADLVSRNVSYGTFTAQEVAARLNGKKGKLFVDLKSSQGEGKRLAATGNIGISKTGATPRERILKSTMDLELDSSEHGLEFASLLTGSIEKTGGTFRCERLKLGGTFSKPVANGTVTASDLTILPSLLKNELTAKTAVVSLDGAKITLPRTRVESKRGEAHVSGEMDISDFTLEADVEMRELRINPSFMKTELSGELDLIKKGEILDVTGNVEVTGGTIRLYPKRFGTVKDISFVRRGSLLSNGTLVREPEDSGFYMEKTRINILADISSDTWVKTQEANLNTTGKLRFEKKPEAELAIQGEMVSSEGFYTVFGKLFEIESSAISFTGNPRTPSLSIRALHTVGEVDVEVDASGVLGEQKITFTSTPSLEETEIVSLIVFGSSSSQLQRSQRSMVQKFALALASGGISEVIGSEIGLDILSIHEGEQGLEDSTLHVGSYLTKDILVYYERTPSLTSLEPSTQMQNRLKLEWKMNKKFSLESHVGGENSGADFFYILNF